MLVLCSVLWFANTVHAQENPPQGPPAKASTTRTKVVLLGTGTPIPDPDRSGPATAIVVDDRAYLIDFGPGVVRRAEAAALKRELPAVEPGNLKVAFVTHLHSDHTAGYSDLILGGWTSGRTVPLEVYGPTGLQSMTYHILEAYRVDIETRTNPDGNQRRFPDGWKVNAHEIKSESFIRTKRSLSRPSDEACHGELRISLRNAGPTIVISGDTNPVEEMIKACNGCDVLIHEAQPLELLAKMPESIQSFDAKYHTTTKQLAELATKAKPKLLIIYHTVSFPPGIAPPRLLRPTGGRDALYASPEMLEKEIGSRYSGRFAIGKDLDVY